MAELTSLIPGHIHVCTVPSAPKPSPFARNYAKLRKIKQMPALKVGKWRELALNNVLRICASQLYVQLCAYLRNFSMYFILICAKLRTFVHNFATLRSFDFLLTFA